ncbi:MAG TPA: BON domain-containing protein [Labilithrix sp.]|nr:BON domain-containing protein [Labilithrix sp.]
MRKAIVVLLGALSLVACAQEKPAEDVSSTKTTAGEQQSTASVEQIRTFLLEKRPGAAEEINALVIRNDSGIVTLQGRVDDEQLRSDLVKHVRAMQSVRGVKDELYVKPKTSGATESAGQYGTSTMTGAPLARQDHEEKAKAEEKERGELSKSDAVRKAMEKTHPKSEPVIHALTITDDGQTVTLKGAVPDEATHQALIKTARATPGVKNVRDELTVSRTK